MPKGMKQSALRRRRRKEMAESVNTGPAGDNGRRDSRRRQKITVTRRVKVDVRLRKDADIQIGPAPCKHAGPRRDRPPSLGRPAPERVDGIETIVRRDAIQRGTDVHRTDDNTVDHRPHRRRAEPAVESLGLAGEFRARPSANLAPDTSVGCHRIAGALGAGGPVSVRRRHASRERWRSLADGVR